MLTLAFLLAFTLHNIEEGLWLPAWSKTAGRFHPAVSKNEFHFALIVITTAGYLFTFLNFALGGQYEVFRYLYLGFVAMMCFNALYPHLLGTVCLRKYAPGTLTGLLLNLPVGLYIIVIECGSGINYFKLAAAFVIITASTVISLKPLFKLGGRIIEKY